ncbi:SAM-dependent methyltransferase [Streptomyces sp. NBC_01016]|uniref:SAM-dependent methyltransferase n=1 Tax=Streptomyces sp. NBC_01016 TaxID=2903720 RepID=UPI0022530364|nr:SAM-dependent methyltransferase [Streptomyces sp. NBC_01016]MCX4835298.1 SAM-dependent methyltransferase [Streptomyces sp. NBC_01016]
MPDSAPRDPAADPLRTDVSHSARIWNYWLGGKDHYEVDAEVGGQVLAFVPELPRSAVADRRFLARAVRYLAGEAGIRQFLDIGTGLPVANNTHEVAQGVDPSCRIVYVDKDPVVLDHAQALLTSAPEGATDYIEADARDPEAILRGAAATLDLDQPIAITMLGVLNFVMDTDEAVDIVRRLLDAAAPGSHLVVSHPTTEVDGEAMVAAVEHWNSQGSAPMTLRNREDLGRIFSGVELLPPGIVSCSRWRPEPADGDVEVTHFAGVGVKR